MGINSDYNSFISSLKAKGLKTTSLGNGEANFADYGNALNSELKSEILNSIGDESGDQQLQAKIAGLFGSKSVLDSGTIQSKAKAAGLKCSVEYKSTSYIVDNKLDGKYDKDVTKGKIAVYTFTDPQTGATVKIADANGNGSVEMEEVFMNEILGDVASSIGVSGSESKGPNPVDEAKARLEAIQKQLEESQKNIQEIVENAQNIDVNFNKKDETKEAEKVKEKEQKAEPEEEISVTDFKNKVLQHALSRYSSGANSIEAIDSSVIAVGSQYENFDTSKIDILELAQTFKNEVEKQKPEKEE